MRRRRQPEIIAGRVNADGSIAAGDGFTVQKTGTGAYTVTLAAGFRLVGAAASQYGSGNYVAMLSAFTDRAFSATIYVANTGVAQDQPFTFVAVGVQQ